MYIVKNKDSGEVELIGSISAIAKHTGIKVNSLYQRFCRRHKVIHPIFGRYSYYRTKFENEIWLIEKKTVIKSKRNEN